MDKYNEAEGLLDEIATIKKGISPRQIKRLKLDLLERIIKRLGNLSENCDECCDECKEYFDNIKNFIDKLKGEITTLENYNYKEYHKKINDIVRHLNKKHGLVTDDYYLTIYMSMGVGLGVAIGTALNNVGVWICLGISIGIGLGFQLDAKAKKEGKVI